ncbi:hypothetical protein KUF83_03860 [Streptomyces sp. BV286]|uniref:hypothetical protein n=1 Tax=Streptomyces sp. BV286 TaxID=2849672 RepID=UPI001C2E2347|nr:hypothetical protein [Streptomyces sp. BV286]MBV1935698.1 hypothetical protein [Streptomyces sp. BV286]
MSLRPFNPEFLPEGHPDKIAKRSGGTVPAALWRGLVRYCLRPTYRGLVALGSMHVASLWHPELGPAPCPPEDEPESDPPSYRTSRVRLQSTPKVWPHRPTSRGEL